jgi:hypothetical protein
MKTLKIVVCLQMCFAASARVSAQTTPFDLAAYQQFLSQHQNMPTSQLLEMYPAGSFRRAADLSGESVSYLDSIITKYDLTEDEKQLLSRHGFVVTERLRKAAFAEQFIDVWTKDLPVFISADAILHALHYKYDFILRGVEEGLIDRLIQLLRQMHSKLPELAGKYANHSELHRMFRDVDVYLTVPLLLLEQGISPNYPENQSEIDEILDLIHAEQPANYPFFSEHCKAIDFSQFKPRGHYAWGGGPFHRDRMPNYFRTMMWLGRIEIYLLPPNTRPPDCPEQTFADIRRQTIDAALIVELLELANVQSIYEEVEDILTFFVGEQDNVTPANLQSLEQELNLSDAGRLLDSLTVVEFQDSLKTKAFAFQRIMSQLLEHDPFSPESIRPASAFLLFGQRYVIDSYVTGSVVFDQIKYNGGFPCRLFPSTLDVLFALGNDASAQLLIPELDAYHYSTNLAALRYLVDAYEPEFWSSSLYNMWLNAIRALNPPADRQSLPAFMQTAAWWQQKMNSQLASWAELRHDNLLYAKQSYTGIGVCSYPYGYVEPVPLFYQRMKTLAQTALEKFSRHAYIGSYVTEFFDLLYQVSDTLESIASKELAGLPIDDNEIGFMRRTIQDVPNCMPTYGGWYIKLWSTMEEYQTEEQQVDFVVADYHTTPSDCAGNIMGWVSHAGTGSVDLAILTVPNAEAKLIAYAGPVASYHEYVTTNFQRLTDDEWAEAFLTSASRPDWVNLYLANAEGKSRGAGATLITGVRGSQQEEAQTPSTQVIAQNYPNPFNASTIIRFVVSSHLTNSLTELTIYSLQGKAVKTLVQKQLPSGVYLTRWDATDDSGCKVASGVYLYQLKVGNDRYVGKMNLVK